MFASEQGHARATSATKRCQSTTVEKATIPIAADAQRSSGASVDKEAIRTFRVHIADATLADLRRRLAATRWPDPETVSDLSQGEQTSTMKGVVDYWMTSYDWRKAEARLNALPQFVTEIDGVDIYFIHVKSRHPGALPILLTHGWPGSVFEFLTTFPATLPQ